MKYVLQLVNDKANFVAWENEFDTQKAAEEKRDELAHWTKKGHSFQIIER